MPFFNMGAVFHYGCCFQQKVLFLTLNTIIYYKFKNGCHFSLWMPFFPMDAIFSKTVLFLTLNTIVYEKMQVLKMDAVFHYCIDAVFHYLWMP